MIDFDQDTVVMKFESKLKSGYLVNHKINNYMQHAVFEQQIERDSKGNVVHVTEITHMHGNETTVERKAKILGVDDHDNWTILVLYEEDGNAMVREREIDYYQ